ncbi:hypothetical protein [Kitasatospora azatica]|uniref:hypothetical protein n=1 Tax=Kitasatospora azatica TaxID=58347 RepID=UPI00056078F2|nr:hypothetical protein [Kitasatospora azatica]
MSLIGDFPRQEEARAARTRLLGQADWTLASREWTGQHHEALSKEKERLLGWAGSLDRMPDPWSEAAP